MAVDVAMTAFEARFAAVPSEAAAVMEAAAARVAAEERAKAAGVTREALAPGHRLIPAAAGLVARSVQLHFRPKASLPLAPLRASCEP